MAGDGGGGGGVGWGKEMLEMFSKKISRGTVIWDPRISQNMCWLYAWVAK